MDKRWEPNPKGKMDDLFEAGEAVEDMASYTLDLVSNPKIFKPIYERVGKISAGLAYNVLTHTNLANKTKVYTSFDWDMRRKSQLMALSYCVTLLSNIKIVGKSIHLRSRKENIWSGKVNTALRLLKAWADSDYERYRHKFK